MTNLLAAFCVALTLTGCAITSSHHSGPNGRPVHYIDGMTASAAYSKAAELCPQGYAILGAPDQKSVLDYVMTIECKASRAAPPRPVEAVAAAPAAKRGRYAYTVENLPQVRSCHPYPVPRLDASGAGVEKYTVLCEDGDALAVRCDNVNCRVLQ